MNNSRVTANPQLRALFSSGDPLVKTAAEADNLYS
jgi:hypothetical protein